MSEWSAISSVCTFRSRALSYSVRQTGSVTSQKSAYFCVCVLPSGLDHPLSPSPPSRFVVQCLHFHPSFCFFLIKKKCFLSILCFGPSWQRSSFTLPGRVFQVIYIKESSVIAPYRNERVSVGKLHLQSNGSTERHLNVWTGAQENHLPAGGEQQEWRRRSDAAPGTHAIWTEQRRVK